MKDQFVMISSRELRRLIEKSTEYDTLERAGLDKWQVYEFVNWGQLEEDIKEKLMEFGI